MSDVELKKYLEYLKELDREESQCNVGRSDIEERFETKKRSMGFIASFLNCGVIVGFTDSVNHEGPRIRLAFTIRYDTIRSLFTVLYSYDSRKRQIFTTIVHDGRNTPYSTVRNCCK
jgi:hypothetical protein